MKNIYVLIFCSFIISSCSKSPTNITADSSSASSLSQKLSSSFISDLQTSSSNSTTNKMYGLPFFLKYDMQTMDTTFSLSTIELEQIKTAITAEIAAENLDSSNELNSVLPAVLAGAETALGSFTNKTVSEKMAIISVLGTSAVSVVSTFNSYAVDIANTDNASKESQVLKTISESIVSHASQAGFVAADLSSLSENITSTIVKNIDKAGIPSEKVAESINFAAAGAVVGLNNISAGSMSGFDLTIAQNAMQSITSGAISAFGEIKSVTSGTQVPDLVKSFTSQMTGSISLLTSVPNLNVNSAQDFIKNISSGATKGIGAISRTDMTVDDLPKLVAGATEGAIQGLGNISLSGFTTTQLPDYVKKVAEGSVGGLGQITHTSFDSNNYSTMIENISAGATKGLGSITMTGFSNTMLPNLAESIAGGSTGVLGSLLEGKNPSLLTTMVSSISKGSTAALQDLNTSGKVDLSTIPDMAKSITRGATQALPNITMTGYSSTIMEGMLTSISQGAAAGFANYTMTGFDETKMTAVMTSISAGATEGINNFGTITNLTSGTFNSSTALSNIATGLSTAAGDMTDKYNISSASLTSAITTGINTGISTGSSTLEVPNNLNTTITSGFTAGPMVYSAFFQDNDSDSGQIGGMLSIVRAMNEESVTSYRIYYGSDPNTKLGNALTEIQKSSLGLNVANFSFEVATNTVAPQGAHYFLIYTVTTSESSKGFPVPIYDFSQSTSTTTGSYVVPPTTTYTSGTPSPVGTWASACLITGMNSSYRFSATFSDTIFAVTGNDYDDTTCTHLTLLEQRTSTYTVTGAATIPAGSYKINFTLIAHTQTPKTADMVTARNSQAQFGFTNWVLDQPKDLYNVDLGHGIHNQTYTVFKIDGSTFYGGEGDSTNTGDTEIHRHQSLDMSFPAVKQNPM